MKRAIKNISLLVLFVFMQIGCASYTMAIYQSKVPVYFSDESKGKEEYRRFRFERHLTWVAFDAVEVQELDLDAAFKAELPNAKKIINLRITSEESGLDSLIRFAGSLTFYILTTDRALVSRRTVTVEGEVLE